MSVLLKDIGSALISSLLCKYINNVDPDQITIALGRGELTLRNVTVRESALADHQIPFKVVASRIGNISIQIPYRYTQAPATIEVDDVDVLLNVTGNVIIESDMSTPQRPEISREKKEENRGFFGNMLYGVMEQIVANLRFKITNVHLRVEYESGGVLAGGIIIKEIECFTVNENRERVMVSTTPDVLFKELIVDGLSIYMDSSTQAVNQENFQESMAQAKTGPHEYVLENFGVNGILRHPKEATEAANEIDVKSEKLWLHVSRSQFLAYEKMQQEIKRFNVKRYYAKCGLPDRLPKSARSSGLWWRYAKNCALLRRDEHTLKIDVALKFLQNRESTRALFESAFEKPDDEELNQKLEELADQLGNEAYMLLHVRAKTLWRMSKEQKPNITDEELEELERAEKFRTSGLLVDYEITEFGVKLTNEEQRTGVLTLNDVAGRYKKIGAEYYTSCNIANILLVDKEDTHIFELAKSGERKASEFAWSNNSVLQTTSITFQATAPKIIYKIPFINDFNAFSKKVLESDARFDALLAAQVQKDMQPEIKKEIENHQSLQLNVHLDAPVVTIPTVMPIYIVLGSVDVKSLDQPKRISASDVSALYDKYDVKFSGFELLIDDKKVCHPIEANISFSTLFVTLPDKPKNVLQVDVDTIDIRVNRLQYLACLALMDMVSPSKTAPQPQQQEEVNPPASSGFDSLSACVNFKKVELSVFDLDFSVFSINSIDGISIQYDVVGGRLSAMLKIANCQCLTRRKDALLSFDHRSADEDALSIAVEMDPRFMDVRMDMASCNLFLDPQAVKGTLQCFDPPSKRERKELMMSEEMMKQMASTPAVDLGDDDDEMIQQKCRNRKRTNIAVNLKPFSVVCPAEKETQQILIKLDGLGVECKDDVDEVITDPNMCYNKYILHVHNFGLYFGNEVGISPVSVDVSLLQSFIRRTSMPKYKVSLDIPEISLGMTQEQSVALRKLPYLLSRKYDPEDMVPVPAANQSPTPFIDVRFALQKFILLLKGTGKESTPDVTLAVHALDVHLQSAKNRDALDLAIHDIQIGNGDKVKISTTPKDSDNSITVEFRATEHISRAFVSISQPVVRTSFEWAWRVKDFVMPPKDTDEQETVKSETDSKPQLTIDVTVTEPTFVLGLHGQDHRHHLRVNGHEVKAQITDFVAAELHKMVMSIDDRPITAETELGITFQDGVIQGNLGFLDLKLETIDYRFFMDLLGYYRSFIPSTPLPDILTDAEYKWDKIVNLREIRACLSEDGKKLFAVNIGQMLVRMSDYEIQAQSERLYVEEFMETELHEDRVLVDGSGFLADVYNDRKVVMMKRGSKFFAKLVPVNFLFNLVIYPTGLKERLLKYRLSPDPGEFVIMTFVEPEFTLMPPGKNFGTLTTDQLCFKFMRSPHSVSILSLDFEESKIKCDHLGVFHDFCSWDSASITFRNPDVTMTVHNAALALQYDLFMETTRYLLGLIATEPPKPGPYTMPPYFYKIYFDRMLATVIPRKMDDPNFCLVFDLRPLTIVTGATPDILLIDAKTADVLTANGATVATAVDFHIEETLVQFDPEVLSEEQRQSTSLFIRQFLTKCHMTSCFWIYGRRTMEIFLAVLQSFFAQTIPKRDEPDPFELSFDSYITMDKFDMDWYDTADAYICSMSAKGFWYRVYLEQEVTMQSLELRTHDYLWAECDKTLTTPSVRWKKDDKSMITTCDHVSVTLDYVTCGRLTTEIMISPILVFRVRPPEPDEQPNYEYYTAYIFLNSEFIFPVDPPEKSEIMIMRFEEFVWSMKNDWQYEAKNLVAMFAPEKGKEDYLPFVKFPSLKYHNAIERNGRVYILAASAFDMTVGSIDIVSFLLIWQNVNKMLYQWSWESTPDERVLEHNRFILHMDRCSVTLSESNRYVEEKMTLLRFSFDPSRSSFPLQINTADVEPSVLFVQLSPIFYMNPETGLPDEIIEAVKVRLEIGFCEERTKFKIDFCDDINMNFSFKALNHILAFTNEITGRIASKSIDLKPRPRFVVVNRTGTDGFFQVGESISKHLDPLEQIEMNISEMSGTEPIFYKQEESDPNPRVLYPANLQYPSFINRSIVVFSKRSVAGQVVKFSSLLRFRNTLTRTMYLLVKQDSPKFRIIAEIPVGKSQGFPISEPLNGKFALTDNKEQFLQVKDHKTFEIKKVKKKYIILKCYVKGGHYDLLLRPKRNESTFVLTILIESLVVAINRLPFEVRLTLGDKPKKLPIDVPVSLPKINYNKPFKGTISRREFGAMVTISTDVDDTTEILFGVEQVTSVAVDAVRHEKSPQIQLIFYAPLIVFNRSGQSLAICDVQKNTTLCFEPRLPESSVDDDGLLLWGTHSYFLSGNKRSLAIRIGVAVDENSTVIGSETGAYVYSDVIETLTLDTHKQLLIPNPTIDDTFIALHYSLYSAQPYAKSKVLTLFSQIHVVNKLPYNIFLQPVRFDEANKPIAFGLPAQIRTDENVPIHSSGKNFCFGVFSERSPFPVTIDFTKPRRQVMISRSDMGPQFIDYQIDDRGVEVLATFQNALIGQTLMLANTLDIDISYWQFSSAQHVPVKIPVPSNTTTIVGLEDPHVFTTITVCILDKQIHVDWKNLSVKTQEFEDFTVNVEVRPNIYQTQVIYISYALDTRQEGKQRDLVMKMNIPSIRVSLIDDYPREFMLFSMRHIILTYTSNETLNTFNVFVHAIQLDDLHPLATYPVAVVGVAQNGYHFIECRCSSFTNAPFMTHFDNISIRVQTLYTFIDIRFLSDLLTFVLPQQIGTTLIVPPEPVQSGIRNMPVSVDTLTVFNTSFFINSRTSTGRPNNYPLYMSKMRFIPNITKFELVIPFFKSGHGDLSDINLRLLQDAIFHPYMAAIREQIGRILSSIDVLGRKIKVDVSARAGISKMASAQEIQSLASTRVRIPRAMPRKQITKFDLFTSYIQLMIQKIDNNKRYAQESIQVLIDNRERSDITICITQNYIFEIQGSVTPQIVKPFFKIKEVTSEIENEKNILVKWENKSLVIECGQARMAQVVWTYLRSKRLALRIGNM